MKPTRTYLLIEKFLGQPLDKYVRELRDDERSWPYIARKIKDQTHIDVSDETLRGWFVDTEASAGAR